VDLSIIIVSYNVKYFLEQCLYSVQKAITGLSAEIIVVDNNSTDDTINYLQPAFPTVTFLLSKENLGFGRANNWALTIAKGNYILFLNPDTIVPEDCFTKCIAFFKTHAYCGALGAKMIDGSGNFLPESKRSFPSPLTSFYKLAGLSALFPKSATFNKYALGHLNENQNHEVDVLCGAFMMLSKEVATKTKGFDEAFFMYGEDIDLSYRIQKLGFKNYYFAETTIIHFKGESAGQQRLKHNKMFYDAMLVFVKKHYGGGKALLFSLLLQLAILLRASIGFVGKIIKQQPMVNQLQSDYILVGDEQSIESAKALLSKATTTSLPYSTEVYQDLSAITNKHIIFCEGHQYSFNKVIEYLHQHTPPNYYYFHAFGSQSIIASNSKKLVGLTLH
jgi:GT2 family glycosyltransferase